MNQDILTLAQDTLGPAVRVEAHRNWAIFYCPFHDDRARAGRGGHANFGVHLEKGHWKCLRCGESGGTLKSLRYKLGQNWQPPVSETTPIRAERPPTQVELLDEALADTRSRLHRSPAMGYLASRGVSAYTALVYGLGYGVARPAVRADVIRAANQSLMLRRDGSWLWAGGVVYADPPTHPDVLNVRYIPDDQLPAGTRNFTPQKHHKTWGNRIQPLGAWRIRSSTQKIIVLEGLFDLLVTAQKLHDLGRDADTVAVYTNGSSPSARMLAWFAEHNRYEYVLIRDSDEAGLTWEERLTEVIRYGDALVQTYCPPDDLDPDEAILSGWWPSPL